MRERWGDGERERGGALTTKPLRGPFQEFCGGAFQETAILAVVTPSLATSRAVMALTNTLDGGLLGAVCGCRSWGLGGCGGLGRYMNGVYGFRACWGLWR